MSESAVFEISDVLVCAQESQNSCECILLRFPTSCSAHRSPFFVLFESAVHEISDVLFCAQDSHHVSQCSVFEMSVVIFLKTLY